MENILKIIYDKTYNSMILSLKDIEKILELLILEKKLNDYILNINVQQLRINNLASYSYQYKEITIYIKTIDHMIKNIENNILNTDYFETILYKNLCVLQILLHEVEHANQRKIAYNDNTLEALIIRLSNLVNSEKDEKLYEYCPEERLAEIKSFEEISYLISYINKKLVTLPDIIETEKLRRLLSGYHYENFSVNIPIIDYFTYGNKQNLLEAFDLSTNNLKRYTLNERFKFGFPISIDEYGNCMKNLVIAINHNFKNKINFKKY